ncbi:MAG: hypothetical protein M1834_000058 [Cirrosporium novae-zelandiae]|nr:MAG: hypothetical protein M1834_000058 [Cirrosporium novae-zelandiae]
MSTLDLPRSSCEFWTEVSCAQPLRRLIFYYLHAEYAPNYFRPSLCYLCRVGGINIRTQSCSRRNNGHQLVCYTHEYQYVRRIVNLYCRHEYYYSSFVTLRNVADFESLAAKFEMERNTVDAFWSSRGGPLEAKELADKQKLLTLINDASTSIFKESPRPELNLKLTWSAIARQKHTQYNIFRSAYPKEQLEEAYRVVGADITLDKVIAIDEEGEESEREMSSPETSEPVYPYPTQPQPTFWPEPPPEIPSPQTNPEITPGQLGSDTPGPSNQFDPHKHDDQSWGARWFGCKSCCARKGRS